MHCAGIPRFEPPAYVGIDRHKIAAAIPFLMIPWLARCSLLLAFFLASAAGAAAGVMEAEEQGVYAPAVCLLSAAVGRRPQDPRYDVPAGTSRTRQGVGNRFQHHSPASPQVSPYRHVGHRLSNGLIAPLLT